MDEEQKEKAQFMEQIRAACKVYAAEMVYGAFGILLACWKGDRLKLAKDIDVVMDGEYPGWREKEGRRKFVDMLDFSEDDK